MVIAVENGSQSPRIESRRLPSTSDVHVSSEPANIRDRYHIPSYEGSLGLKETMYLPSPSRSPSPRSRSPSVAVTDSSAERMRPPSTATSQRRHSSTLEKSIGHSSLLRDDEEAVLSPFLASKNLPPLELHNIPEEQKVKKVRRSSAAKPNGDVLKLSPAELEALTSAPESLPVTSPGRSVQHSPLIPSPVIDSQAFEPPRPDGDDQRRKAQSRKNSSSDPSRVVSEPLIEARGNTEQQPPTLTARPRFSSRGMSTPQSASGRINWHSKGNAGQTSPKRKPVPSMAIPEPLDLNLISSKRSNGSARPAPADPPPSPIPPSIPLPPMSIPTYLQLELSSLRPSPLYIYRSQASEDQYESSKIKFDRLLNFLLLPPQLEQVLYFGSLACLDAWLSTFTILPLRFFKALTILIQWWVQILIKEAQFIAGFIYHGSGRMWHRRGERRVVSEPSCRSRSASRPRRPAASRASSYQPQSGRVPDSRNLNGVNDHLKAESDSKPRMGWSRRQKEAKSQPSSLSSYHKADLLQGAVIIVSCIILMKLDASRMYHSIRGQAAIKLYVIYNLLEVCDKLFSSLGQDIFECLFSDETLQRDRDGRSKILRPLGMFLLALLFNVIHATALFYQVITLNVAVNSYSNALITLLISNQFVEIKSTVFKKFEKDNLFQLTCADIVERFQLWLMLMIIALRNIVEVGGLSMVAEATAEALKDTGIPTRSNSVLPDSFTAFTFLPSWSGEVLTPFLFVLGSEMLVDWIKHAYISKFNSVKPAVYQRYLDVLAKDYYTNAFVDQNLVKRLGLPVIPLSCLFIRSSVQTYHMFLATHVPAPIASTATALSVESSPATTAALEHFDNLIRGALGRSAFGVPDPTASNYWYLPSADMAIAALTMLVFFLGAFFVLLACKLVLGMVLLKFARNRYRSMKKREHQSYDTGGKRVGGWGMVEVDDDKKRWIYDDDPETLRKLKEKERVTREKSEKGGGKEDFAKISRYEMSAKRIW